MRSFFWGWPYDIVSNFVYDIVTRSHLQGRHHLPVTVLYVVPTLNFVVTHSENIVNKSHVLSFFTINSSGISVICLSSRSLPA